MGLWNKIKKFFMPEKFDPEYIKKIPEEIETNIDLLNQKKEQQKTDDKVAS